MQLALGQLYKGLQRGLGLMTPFPQNTWSMVQAALSVCVCVCVLVYSGINSDVVCNIQVRLLNMGYKQEVRSRRYTTRGLSNDHVASLYVLHDETA